MDYYEFKHKIKLLLDTDSIEEVDILCKDYLMYKDYRISKCEYFDYKISRAADLVTLFYNLCDSLKVYTEIKYTRNKVVDTKIARDFLQSRMSFNDIGKKTALKECATIIETVVFNIDKFNFNKVPGFWIFGCASCRWIIDKAIDIINKEKIFYSESKLYSMAIELGKKSKPESKLDLLIKNWNLE